MIFFSYYCSHPQDTVGPPGKLKRFFINTFVKTVDKCEAIVENISPSAFKVYKTFKTGMIIYCNKILIYKNGYIHVHMKAIHKVIEK